MAQEETILLHFDIDEKPAVNSIKDLRAANSQLRAERDKVNISTKEGKELVDKLNVTIDKNNKLIKDNSSALEKQRQNVGNYSKSIKEAAGELNIMGTNVGAVATKLGSFVNPLTATVGVVTALGAAYARSTIGAKDLEFASNQLSSATTILTNAFASLISSSEDGEGFFSLLVNDALQAVQDITNFFGGNSDIAKRSREVAKSLAAIGDLQREEVKIRSQNSERLKENQEKMTLIQEEQTDINEKLHQAGEIIDNLRLNETNLLGIKQKQLSAIQEQLKGDEENSKLLDEQEAKVFEINSIKKDTQRSVEAINRLESNLLNTENKRLLALGEIETKKRLDAVKQPGITPSGTGQNITDFGEQEIKLSNKITGVVVKNDQIKGESAQEYVDRVLSLQDAQAAGARDLAGTLAAIADEGTEAQKALALTSIAINSGIGVSEAVKAGAGVPFPANLAAILSGITAVLAGIAQAKSLLGFAEGGWTGPGNKYKPVGVVHADEYVTPKHIVHSPAAQPHLAALERMRTGYADGGFVTNSNMQSSRDAMLMANTLKNLPPIFTSWTEGRAVGRRVEFKEKVTRQ